MNYRIFGVIAVSVAAAVAAVSVSGCKSKDNGLHKETAVPNVRTATAQSIGSTRTITYPGRRYTVYQSAKWQKLEDDKTGMRYFLKRSPKLKIEEMFGL